MAELTRNELKQIGAGALDVAAAAPWPENRRTYTCRIPWPMIERLRADLEAAGVDWRAFKQAGETD